MVESRIQSASDNAAEILAGQCFVRALAGDTIRAARAARILAVDKQVPVVVLLVVAFRLGTQDALDIEDEVVGRGQNLHEDKEIFPRV